MVTHGINKTAPSQSILSLHTSPFTSFRVGGEIGSSEQAAGCTHVSTSSTSISHLSLGPLSKLPFKSTEKVLSSVDLGFLWSIVIARWMDSFALITALLLFHAAPSCCQCKLHLILFLYRLIQLTFPMSFVFFFSFNLFIL